MIDQFLVSPDDNEIESTKQQVENLTQYMSDRFKDLIIQQRHDDALAIADEYFEWFTDLNSQTVIHTDYDDWHNN
jgi:hypothetical protein